MRLVSVVISTRSPMRDAQLDLRQHVVDLRAHRADLDLRIDQAGRPHHLLDDLRRRARSSYVPGVADTKIICGASRSHSSNRSGRLSSADGRRKPYSTSVSLRERSPLYIAPSCGIGLVALVDDQQRIRRQIVEQARRRLARRAAGQIARVVLDAVAVADLAHHLEVEARALLQPLRLDQLVLRATARSSRSCSSSRISSTASSSRSRGVT